MMSKLLEQIKYHEGLRLKPYVCTAGKLTIGYGRNLEDRGITKYEAELLLSHDLAEVENQLKDKLEFWNALDHVRQAVLINMAFNIGINGLMKFKKTLAMIGTGDYSDAAIEMMDSKWARQVPKRALDLSVQMDLGIFS
jgi:lysozyme